MIMLRKITVFALLVLCASVAHSQVATISAKNTTPCTDAPFSITPQHNVNGDIIPAGTTYSWPAPSLPAGLTVTGIGTATGATSIFGTLHNATNGQLVATYTVTPNTTPGGGDGAPFIVTVTVNPFAQPGDITVSTVPPVCAGLTTSITTTLSGTSTIVNPAFVWYNDVNFISQAGTGTTFTTGVLNNNTTYYVRVSGTNACPNIPGNGQPVTVTVSGIAPNVGAVGNQVVCETIAATQAVNFTSTSQGTIFNWTNDNIGIGLAASGQGNIASFTPINGTNALITATITVTPFTNTNSCQGTPRTFTIKVGAVPAVSNTSFSICSGNTANFVPSGVPAGTTYTWSANTVPSTLNLIVSNAGNMNSSQPSFNPTFANNTLSPVDITFTVTPQSPAPANCAGATFQLTVTVNPTPIVGNQVTTTCSGVGFVISPTSVPTGTTYTWGTGTLLAGTITPLGGQGSAQVSINATLTNSLATTGIIRYAVTPRSAANCAGAAFSATIQVYPRPTLTSGTTFNLCNNVLFNYNATSATSPIDNYSWSRAAVTGITNPATSYSGTTAQITETLNNSGTVSQQVSYQYTLTANGCSNTQTIFVTVKPTLNLSSDLTRNTCSNAVFAYIGTSATSLTTLSWTRTTVADIANAPATGASSINETLINTSFAPVNVTYQYRNTSGTCSDVTNVVVTVNPLPSVNTVPTQVICSGTSTSVALTGSNVANTSYDWTNSNANIGLTNSGAGDIAYPSYNATFSPILATITVVPTANACSGASMSFQTRVNPAPTLNSVLTIPAVCSGAVVAYSPVGNVANTTFTWTRPAVIGIDNLAGSGSGNVNDTLINSSNVPLQVPYNYTETANGCSNTELVNVTINPVPTMFNPGNQLACNNTTKVVNFSGSIVSGTAYFWTNDNPSIGVPAIGTGDIFFVANTSSPDSVYANIRVSPQAYGCVGPEVAFRIIVNPPLSLSSSLTPNAVCSNALFGYTPASTAANPIYIWNRAGINGISNAPASGSGSIQEILVNTTSSPIYVTYDYTISSNGCVKNESVVVQVIPALVLNNTNIANEVCSGSAFTFTPSGNITGVSYLWSRAAVTGVSNAAGSGSGDVNETLINDTNAPVEAAYRFSLGLGASCAADQVIHVTVKPIPKLTGNKTIDACSNTPVAYTPVGNIPGTNFNWSRAAITGIANTSSVGLVGISESLINTTTTTVNASYVYNLTNYNGCANVETVTVRLKPAPVAGVAADQSICADDITKAITFTSNLVGTTFNWTNTEPSIGLAASGSSATIPAFKSVNTSSGQLVAIIQVNPVADGCTGNTVAVARITVNRAITTSFIEVLPVIACEGQPVGPFVASIPLGGDGSTYQFQWQVSTDSVNFVNIPGATSRQLVAPAITKDSWYRMNTVSLGCSARTTWSRVALKVKPTLLIENRDNNTVSIGNSTQLVVSGALNYLWTPADSTINDFRSASPYVRPLKNTTYTVVGTTLDGCSNTDSIAIVVNDQGYQLFPNNILTPNGDGYNDIWKVKNIEFYKTNKVEIYNSNSIKVWTAENYTGDWNGVGTSGGKLPSGTYYYIIKITPAAGGTITTDVQVKGYLTILN